MTDDPRMALIYEESTRALDRQQAVVESLRTRAGVLIAAASVATTFLGRRAVDSNAAWTCLDWYAVGCFVGVAVLSLFILAPRRGWFYTHNIDLLCERYDHHQEWSTLGGMHRRLADANQSNWEDNKTKLSQMQVAFVIASLLLVAEVVFWLMSLVD